MDGVRNLARVAVAACALAHCGPGTAQTSLTLSRGLSNPPGPPGALLQIPPPAAAALPPAIPLAQAVRQALSSNANIRIQAQQARANQGALQQALGAYDTDIVGSANHETGPRPVRSSDTAALVAAGSPGLADERNETTAYGAGVQRTLPSGVRVEASANLSSTYSQLSAVQGVPRQTAGILRIALRVPLQRNAGGIQFSTAVEASELERQASLEDLVQTSSGVVFSVAQAYWELAARQRRLEILRDSEGRAGELVAELRKLIDADQIPSAELNLALANEAEKRAARAAEEQLLQQTWTNLARLLMADAGDVFLTLPQLDPLPGVDESLLGEVREPRNRLAQALVRRPDLRAARLREQAAGFLVAAAHNALRPQVDLVAGATTHSLAESASALNAAGGFGRNLQGPSLNIGVEMRWPYENNVSQGQLLARSAARDQATIRLRDLESSVGPSLASIASAMARTVLRYRETEAASARYAISLQNERTKRRLGLSTLIDVLNVQDRLDAAKLSLLSLQQEYASLLAQLMFESGSLVAREQDEFEVDINRLLGQAARGAGQ